MIDAYQELVGSLWPGEEIEAVVLGNWSGGEYEPKRSPNPGNIPENKRGIPLSLEDAEPMMHGWKFDGGFGGSECYAVYVWTNLRILWVNEYDGSTQLASISRNPVAEFPRFGGDR